MILDHSPTHKTLAIKKWLGKHPHFELHFTPISIRLNEVEGWRTHL